eukprot:m.74484 g.74484  ORF g.74484 m.74484 type:complete len:232 (-) comp10304_c0_seq1:18-713(-)
MIRGLLLLSLCLPCQGVVVPSFNSPQCGDLAVNSFKVCHNFSLVTADTCAFRFAEISATWQFVPSFRATYMGDADENFQSGVAIVNETGAALGTATVVERKDPSPLGVYSIYDSFQFQCLQQQPDIPSPMCDCAVAAAPQVACTCPDAPNCGYDNPSLCGAGNTAEPCVNRISSCNASQGCIENGQGCFYNPSDLTVQLLWTLSCTVNEVVGCTASYFTPPSVLSPPSEEK